MKKLLMLVASLTLVFGLVACDQTPGDDGGDDTTLDTITLEGIEDREVFVDDSVNLLDGVTATGNDGEDYSDAVSVDSETCTISDNGVLDTSGAMICTIDYEAFAEGVVARAQAQVTIKTEPIQVSGPVVMNWDFEDETDLEGWSIYVANGGSIDMSVEDGAMKLITTSGAARYETRLDYQGVPLEQGEDYKISFKAKSDTDGKKFHLNFGELLPSDPYFTPFKAEGVDIFTLTNEWQTFEVTFTMNINNQSGGPLFEMGNMEGSQDLDATIWIDDLEIQGGSGEDVFAPTINGADDMYVAVGEDFDALEGVTANDNIDGDITDEIQVLGETVDTTVPGTYNVVHTVTDEAGNWTSVSRVVTVVDFVADENNVDVTTAFDADMVISDDDAASWFTTIVYGEPIFTAEVVDGELVIVSAKDGDKDYGTNYWDHIVRYTDMKFVDGQIYRITFDAKTDEMGNETANMMVKVESSDFAAEKTLVVEDTYGTQTLTFRYTGNSTLNGALLFFVGGREHVISIKDIDVLTEAAAAEVDNAPFFGEIKSFKGNAIEVDTALDAIEAYDIEDGILVPVITAVGPNGETEFDSNIPGEWEVTLTATDSADQETSVTFMVTVLDAWTFRDTAWEAWYGDQWSGATDSIVTVNEGELVVDVIYEGTPASYATQVFQEGFAVEQGKTYRISFDARADEAKDINVAFGDALDTDPWFTNFAEMTNVTLGTEMTTYTIDFEMTEPTTEDQGKLVFELATAVNTKVYIDNVKIEETTAIDGDIVAETNQVIDGEFTAPDPQLSFDDSAWTAWYGDQWSGETDSVVEIYNGELTVDVIYEGTPASYATQVFQEGFAVEQGKTYRISFDARADEAKDINVAFGDALDTDPWFTNFAEMTTVTLGTEMTTYTIDFEMTEATTEDQGKLVFELATAVNTMVYIDNVKIEETTAIDGNIVEGTNQVLEGTFELPNPDVLFESTTWAAWYGDQWSGETDSVVLIDNGELTVDVIYEGTPASYATQVFQEGFAVENGKFYRISFDARADEAKDINVAFGDALDADPWFTNFAEMTTVTLDTMMQTYTIEFEMTEPTTEDQGKLVFELATAVNTMVYIDNVKLEEIDALGGTVVEGTNQVEYGDFEPLSFDDSAWAAWYGDQWSGETDSVVLIDNGELTVDVIYEGTPASYATQVFQEGFEVENGKFYRITFDARANEAKDINVAFGDALDTDPWFTNFAEMTTVTLGTEMTTYTIEFEMTEPTTADQGKLVFELATAVNTKVFIDNVKIEEIDALGGTIVEGTDRVEDGDFE
ncbi:MAG: carbohydrate binding domain-containing protein [Candidatus Izimaplasma sp.]|nr:carbohydrate binding domain-containing protein [Candidatus Izimaplasma bacterium]